MADEIIDLTRYLKQDESTELPRGSLTLWGADGERSRFALPLWRIIHLARGERGLILRTPVGRPAEVRPYVVLDMAADPARADVDPAAVPSFEPDDGPSLLDLGRDGLAVFLGSRAGFVWTLWVDGTSKREDTLPARVREDVLFLAGECAGLLFLRDLADDRGAPGE
jgi:hypothetical protein